MYLRLMLLLLVTVLAAACGESEAPGAGSAGTDQPGEMAGTEEATETADTTVAVESSDLGDILVDGGGNTLYLLTTDEQGPSTCYDDCATNWPPLEGSAAAGTGADDSLLGTVERDDGTVQVTYNDWPVYYFAGDAQAGDTNGQGVGDVWFAVTAEGEAAGKGGGDDAEDPEY